MSSISSELKDDIGATLPRSVEAKQGIKRHEQILLEADFRADDRLGLALKGLAEPESGLPDPRRPQGMSAVFEAAVSADEAKSYETMLSSLELARAFVQKNSETLPGELRGVAQDVLDDEIARMLATADRMHSLIEV